MAKAPAKPEAAEGEAPPPPKKGKKLLIIIIAVVLLALIAGGAAAFLLLKKKPADGEHGEEEAPKVAVDRSKPPTFVPLDPFTVNLQPGEGDHYLQTVIVLKVADPKVAEDLKAYMPEIRHRVNLLLSSKLPSEIADIEGREALAEEVMIESNFVLGFEPPRKKPKASKRNANSDEPWGPVLAVLFNSFIVQ